MKNLVLYPHIYHRLVNDNLFLYNTISSNHFWFPKYAQYLKCTAFGDTYEIINSNLKIAEIIDNEFGYIIDSAKPSVTFCSINFSSSRDKIVESNTIIDGSNAMSCIESISLYIDTIESELKSPLLYRLLSFPHKNAINISQYYNIGIQAKYTNLKEIEIVSALTERAANFIRNISTEASISWRTLIFNLSQFITLRRLGEEFPNILFKAYIRPELKSSVASHKSNNIYYIFWSEDINDFYKNNEISILPIIYDNEKQKSLINESLLTERDILSTNKSLFDLHYDGFFNRTFMGHISVCEDEIFVANQLIGKITSFKKDFNHWFYRPDNLWFYTRRKKSQCKDCPFVDLCPSISLAEVLGIISNPCCINRRIF